MDVVEEALRFGEGCGCVTYLLPDAAAAAAAIK